MQSSSEETSWEVTGSWGLTLSVGWLTDGFIPEGSYLGEQVMGGGPLGRMFCPRSLPLSLLPGCLDGCNSLCLIFPSMAPLLCITRSSRTSNTDWSHWHHEPKFRFLSVGWFCQIFLSWGHKKKKKRVLQKNLAIICGSSDIWKKKW